VIPRLSMVSSQEALRISPAAQVERKPSTMSQNTASMSSRFWVAKRQTRSVNFFQPGHFTAEALLFAWLQLREPFAPVPDQQGSQILQGLHPLGRATGHAPRFTQ